MRLPFTSALRRTPRADLKLAVPELISSESCICKSLTCNLLPVESLDSDLRRPMFRSPELRTAFAWLRLSTATPLVRRLLVRLCELSRSLGAESHRLHRFCLRAASACACASASAAARSFATRRASARRSRASMTRSPSDSRARPPHDTMLDGVRRPLRAPLSNEHVRDEDGPSGAGLPIGSKERRRRLGEALSGDVARLLPLAAESPHERHSNLPSNARMSIDRADHLCFAPARAR
eukprot:6203665-Pleurochrysis_carterae.AAC.4